MERVCLSSSLDPLNAYHPQRPPLDISKATDEEIVEWLSRK
jgi:hypothetical protein